MKPMKLKELEANNLVKSFLQHHIDCGEELEIIANVDNHFILSYQCLEKIIYHGKTITRISNLSWNEYVTILIQALNVKGYDVRYIKPIIREDIRYEVYFRLYENGFSRKRARK